LQTPGKTEDCDRDRDRDLPLSLLLSSERKSEIRERQRAAINGGEPARWGVRREGAGSRGARGVGGRDTVEGGRGRGEGGEERWVGDGTDNNILASGRLVEPPSIVGCNV
jgi:hypothetical protein